jgi:hypothetical protein
MADCAAEANPVKCAAILGPNGGEGACRYNVNKDRCVNRGTFVDIGDEPEPEPEPIELADCKALHGQKSACLNLAGPNGGAGACRYNTNKDKCFNQGTFVDNPGRHKRTVGVRGRSVQV